MPNAQLAATTLGLIDAHRNMFNMSWWALGGQLDTAEGLKLEDLDSEGVCGTTACVAGFAVLAAGYIIKANRFEGFTVTDPDGNVTHDPHWSQLGADLLGITYDEASRLFVSDEETAIKALGLLAAGAADIDNVLDGIDPLDGE